MSVSNLHEVRYILISTLICIRSIWLGVAIGPIYNTYIHMFFFFFLIYTVGPDVCRTMGPYVVDAVGSSARAPILAVLRHEIFPSS